MRVNIPELEKDLKASLGKLKVDCLELYFLHRDDPAVSVEEILGWLEKKVKEGWKYCKQNKAGSGSIFTGSGSFVPAVGSYCP